MLFYHLTNKKYLPDIMKNGLVCEKRRTNSGRINEERDCIFLTDKESLPYWRLIIEADVLIEVSDGFLDPSDAHFVDYGLYGEYTCASTIPAQYLSALPLPEVDSSAMRGLCMEMLYIFSDTAHMAANLYDILSIPEADRAWPAPTELEQKKRDYEDSLLSSIACGSHLDFSYVPESEYSAWLQEMVEDGSFVFTDAHEITHHKLWELTKNYAELSLFPDLEARYCNLLTSAFPTSILYELDTGGWTSIYR